jgi:hypothetical protein
VKSSRGDILMSKLTSWLTAPLSIVSEGGVAHTANTRFSADYIASAQGPRWGGPTCS